MKNDSEAVLDKDVYKPGIHSDLFEISLEYSGNRDWWKDEVKEAKGLHGL